MDIQEIVTEPEAGGAGDVQGGLPEQEKRENVLRLAFQNEPDRLEKFCRAIEDVVPPGTGVILRGSAVTGKRWRDEAPFDAEGPGTSDLDLTLVGDGALLFFKPTGWFVPGIHTRPLSDVDPDIAPDLVPLRQKLMEMVGRPVNIQATRDFFKRLRHDVFDQAYLTLFVKPEGLSITGSVNKRVTFRLLTYNIMRGGGGRIDAIAGVIKSCDPDLVLLQEATDPSNVERIAAATGMADWQSFARQSLAFVSRRKVASANWIRPRISRHAFIEVVPEGEKLRIYGVHLSAVHAAWTEYRRVLELRALLRSVARHQHGFHVLGGDFNTIAPNETLKVGLLPRRLRPLIWLSGGRVRWRTIQTILDAGYTDGYRAKHPDDLGATLPAGNPNIRLDFVFVPQREAHRLRGCEVVKHPDAAKASDHLPVLADLDA